MNQSRQAAFRFQPFSRRQKQVLTWWCDGSPVRDAEGIIADGSIRSGKTVSLSLGFCLWSMSRFSGQNFALCGKTIASLRRNVLGGLKQMLTARGYTAAERRGDNLLILRRGSVENYYYLFGGKDEASQDLIQGITLAGALFDEVALMPESFVNQATARCSVAGSKFWFNCNPEGPMHWFYKEWVLECKRRNVLHLHFTMADNLSLSEKIKQRYEGMYTGVFYARYILGKWTKAEGLVYPFFNAEKHMIDDDGARGRYYISCDYGTLNPCVFGLWRVNGNSAFMVKEYYYDGRKKGKQKTDEEYYADLEAFADGYLIEQVVIDPSAASFKETIRRHGKFSVKNAKNDVLDGIRDTGTMLQASLLHFNKTCVNTKAEFGAYAWDEKSSSDAVIKENDHSMDQMRYFVRTIMKREVRAYGIK